MCCNVLECLLGKQCKTLIRERINKKQAFGTNSAIRPGIFDVTIPLHYDVVNEPAR